MSVFFAVLWWIVAAIALVIGLVMLWNKLDYEEYESWNEAIKNLQIQVSLGVIVFAFICAIVGLIIS